MLDAQKQLAGRPHALRGPAPPPRAPLPGCPSRLTHLSCAPASRTRRVSTRLSVALRTAASSSALSSCSPRPRRADTASACGPGGRYLRRAAADPLSCGRARASPPGPRPRTPTGTASVHPQGAAGPARRRQWENLAVWGAGSRAPPRPAPLARWSFGGGAAWRTAGGRGRSACVPPQRPRPS